MKLLNKKIIATSLVLMAATHLSSYAYAEETGSETINRSSKSDEEYFLELETQLNSLNQVKEELETRINGLEDDDGRYWGNYQNGGEGTWLTLWGFVFPGVSQLFTIFDDRAPAWLRWVGVGQLISLGAVSYGASQYFSPDQNIFLGSPLEQQPQYAFNTFLGGAGAYTALALVPSTIVSIHDNITKTDTRTQLIVLKQELLQNKIQISKIEPIFNIYQQAKDNQLENAIHLADSQELDYASKYGIDSDRILQWKQKLFQDDYQVYLNEIKDVESEVKLEKLEEIIKHPYLSSSSTLFDELRKERSKLEKIVQQERELREARETQEAQEKEREDIYLEAYNLASDGDFFEAVKKLETYDWKPEHSQYDLVQEKMRTWNYAWFTSMYKYAFNKAGDGDVEDALETLTNLQYYWPIDHPDYNRVKQKIKDWTAIIKTRNQIKVKHGYLTDRQIQILKEKKYPIIMTTTFPSNNGWQFHAVTHGYLNEYYILYYDTTTGKSFTILGGQYCGRLSSSIYNTVSVSGKEYVQNPVLGRVGVLSLGYLDAYITTNLSKNKQNGMCYALVTPGNLESWMTDYGEDDPGNLKRLTKAEFIEVVKALKYLP